MKYLIILLIFISACKTNQKTVQQSANLKEIKPDFASGKPIMVYKTKNDYSTNVPVLLSDDKSEIVSYPHPSDLASGKGFPLPTTLNNGYLLDNRGINKNVAYLKITYGQYAKMTQPLSLKEMYSFIIDKDPLTELCNCGNKNVFTDLNGQLNKLIDDQKLRTTCKVIK